MMPNADMFVNLAKKGYNVKSPYAKVSIEEIKHRSLMIKAVKLHNEKVYGEHKPMSNEAKAKCKARKKRRGW